jgi:hypothetical protein
MTLVFNNYPLPVTVDLPQPGLLDFINQFGDLWVGKLSVDYFIHLFCERKQQLLDNITSYFTNNRNDDRIVDSNFRLSMIQKSLIETWRQPGFMYYNQPPVTGNSRLLASGLGHQSPWDNFNFLVFAPKNVEVKQVLNPVKVVSDDQLWQILGLDKNPRDVVTQLLLDNRFDSARPSEIDLVFINHNFYQKNQIQILTDYVDNYQRWQSRYKNQNNKFNIGIFTDWPDQIFNTDNFWNVTILGPSKVLKSRIVNPANFEKIAWDEHYNKSVDIDHVLWINHSRKIDLAELLFWTNLNYTTYIDQYWEFILYRRDQAYRSQYVSVSNF